MSLLESSDRHRKTSTLSLKALLNGGLSPLNQNVCTLCSFGENDALMGSTPETGMDSASARQAEANKEVILSQKACLVFESVRSFKRVAKFSELEDLLQEGFLFLWEFIDSGNFQDLHNNEWLLRKIKNHLRDKRGDQTSTHKLRDNLLNSGLLPVHHAEVTEIELELVRKCIDRALENLTPAQRGTIALRYGLVDEPLKIKDIATMTNKTPRAVRKQHQTGKAALAKEPDLHLLAS
jgi:RNA polymerase sigma factor (sigma-70 family)